MEPLIAFEAAARLESFTAAGDELCLSQAAISKQIRLLEQNLGHELFSRARRRVVLTPRGNEFLHVVTHALSQISAASMEMRLPSESEVAKISVGHALGHTWLARKLPSFFTTYPGARLEITCLTEQKAPNSKDDLTIMAGDGVWPGFEARMLVREFGYPVCSPLYLQQIGGFLEAGALQRVALLELEDEQPACMTWRIWMTGNGLAYARPDFRLKMDSYPLMLDAARGSLGVMLGWEPLIRPYLDDGSLVRCMPQSFATEVGYHVIWHGDSPKKVTAQRFLEWLLSQRED